MEATKYACIYTASVSDELWPKIRQITIDLGLHHQFYPYQGIKGDWHFKVGGSVEQHNEFSRLWAELEPVEEVVELSIMDKIKNFFGLSTKGKK